MSTFNQARYNLSKFNIEQSEQVWATGTSRTTFGFSFAGETIYFKGNAAVQFLADKMDLNPGRVFSGSAAETFMQQVNGIKYCILHSNVSTAFEADLNLSQEAHLTGITAETFEAAPNLSQGAHLRGSSAESFDTEPNWSIIVNASANAGEIFDATADVVSLANHICEFPGLKLKPGEELIIDANTYNVLLNGENAIYLQKGDWLDDLSRNTQAITISATGGARLEASILYTERYL